MTQRRFRAGEVLGRSLAIWGRGAHVWLFLALLAYLPLLAFGVWLFAGRSASDPPLREIFYALKFGGDFMVQLVTGALVYGVVQKWQHRRAGVMRCVGVALSRFFSLFGVAAVIVLLTTIPWGLRGLLDFGPFVYWAWRLAVLYVLAMFWVAVPAAVVERLGPAAALHRSLALTRGFRTRIFGILLLFIAVWWGGRRLASIVILESAFERMRDGSVDASTRLLIHSVFTVLFAVALTSVRGVTMAVGYVRLREAKEGMTQA